MAAHDNLRLTALAAIALLAAQEANTGQFRHPTAALVEAKPVPSIREPSAYRWDSPPASGPPRFFAAHKILSFQGQASGVDLLKALSRGFPAPKEHPRPGEGEKVQIWIEFGPIYHDQSPSIVGTAARAFPVGKLPSDRKGLEAAFARIATGARWSEVIGLLGPPEKEIAADDGRTPTWIYVHPPGQAFNTQLYQVEFNTSGAVMAKKSFPGPCATGPR
jgi:hypothetical protein